jgi:hypothetical protein
MQAGTCTIVHTKAYAPIHHALHDTSRGQVHDGRVERHVIRAREREANTEPRRLERGANGHQRAETRGVPALIQLVDDARSVEEQCVRRSRAARASPAHDLIVRPEVRPPHRTRVNQRVLQERLAAW